MDNAGKAMIAIMVTAVLGVIAMVVGYAVYQGANTTGWNTIATTLTPIVLGLIAVVMLVMFFRGLGD